MSDPEQAGLRKVPGSSPDLGAAAPLQSSPSAHQGGGVTWATPAISPASAAPGSSSPGERACRRLRGRRAATGEAPLGVTQKGLGARLPVTGRSGACRSLRGWAHASTHAPPPVLKGEAARGLGGSGAEPGWSGAGFDNFSPARGRPEAVLPSSKATSFRKRVATSAETNLKETQLGVQCLRGRTRLAGATLGAANRTHSAAGSSTRQAVLKSRCPLGHPCPGGPAAGLLPLASRRAGV